MGSLVDEPESKLVMKTGNGEVEPTAPSCTHDDISQVYENAENIINRHERGGKEMKKQLIRPLKIEKIRRLTRKWWSGVIAEETIVHPVLGYHLRYKNLLSLKSKHELDDTIVEAYCDLLRMEQIIPRMLSHLGAKKFDKDRPLRVNVIAERPKQENGTDCGVFVCKYIDSLLTCTDYTAQYWSLRIIDTFCYCMAWELSKKGEARKISTEGIRLRFSLEESE
ncbi:hypothetical protein POM88_035136 [Heracleum sosnowskyi]|uniref:Ubiquitin-like protease family profile domain-containing protein n=1 Tax=Heracleum sosnowskyi TaxID=360622 RepID=A0AAD8HMH1_9APIA|nr:hypothetical protein POM88_035136 [Heracleum sosnowskyi]